MKLKITLMAVGSILAAGAFAQPAAAVRELPTYTAVPLNSPDPQAKAQFGAHLDAVGDLNGDGVNDFAVSSDSQDSGAVPRIGVVWVFSGRTRELIRTIHNPDPQSGNGFGDSVLGIGDVNGDGVPDVVTAGAAQNVYTGAGTACGTPEAPPNPPNGCNEFQGRVYIFSGRTGSLIRRVEDPAPQEFAFFGYGNVIAPGDLNGDGVPDFVVTTGETIDVLCDDDQDPTTPLARPCPGVGAAYAFSGKDGSLIHRFDDPDPVGYASFGSGTSNPGDVTGDGVGDLVIGAFAAPGGGRAYLFNGKTGALVRAISNPDPEVDQKSGGGGGFGFGVGHGIEPGDVDGDGVRDLVVAAPGHVSGDVDNAGRLYLLSGKDGSLIRILSDPNPKPSGSLGYNNASAGDLNDDGTSDILASRFIFPPHAYEPLSPPGAAAYVFDGKTGAPLVTLPGMEQDGPGSELVSPGDLNGDGYPDYVLGGRLLDGGAGDQSGRVIVELSKAAPPPSGPPATPPASPPATPAPVKPPPAIPPVARVSVAGFTARVSPRRDRRAPYRFTVSGAVRRPTGIAASACKGGRVSVQTKVGSKTISTRRVTLRSNCSYRVRVTFRDRRRLGRGRLTLRVRFLGNARFKPAGPRTLSVRAG